MGNSNIVRIGDIAEVFDGPHATPKKIDVGPYFLSISSLENGQLDLSKSAHISDEQFEKWTRRVTPREGDVLFSYETRLGEAALMPDGIKACLGRRMGLLRPKRNKVLPEYLLYAYLSPEFQQQIKRRTNHGATVERISLKELPDFEIRVPSIEEQQKVVQVIKAFPRKLELNQQTNQTLEQMAQALFKSWFVDFDPVVDNALAAGNPIPEELSQRVEVRKKAKALPDFQPLPEHIRNLFPSEFEQTGESTVGIDGWVPKSWLLTPFGELLDKTIGGDWGKDSIDEKHTERCRIIRGTDIPNISDSNFDRVPDRWVQEKKLKSRCLKHGDIVIEVSGGSPTQSTGRSLKITEKVIDQLGGIVAPASFCRLFRPLREHLSTYLSEHLLYIYGEGKMWGYQNQSTGISNFQTKIFLASELLAVPNEKLLAEFEKTISNFDRKKYIGQTATLAALRDYLLPKLISGEIQLDFLTDGNANQEAELQGV